MKSLLGLVQSAPCRIDIEFKDADGKPYKKTTQVKSKKDEVEEVPLYTNKDTIMGEIRITPLTVKKVEHQGIKIQLLGQIELANERGTVHEFVSLVRELAVPGDLSSSRVYPFEFKNVELQYDSYKGQQVRCRYLLRVTVTGKGMTPDAKREFNIWVINYEHPNEAAAPIKMEVGIEDCLHIEFEYDRARYHLQDVVVGRIYFLLVRIKLKHMEVEIRRKETTGAGTAAHSESETLAKYEIMDGAPVRGESVPIRLYLSPYDLAPTYKEVHNKFSVRYFLNLVLVDEEDRRYFKQQEITLFRKFPDAAGTTATTSATGMAAGPPKLMSYASHVSPMSAMQSSNGSPAPATASNGMGTAPAASTPTVSAPSQPSFSGAGSASWLPNQASGAANNASQQEQPPAAAAAAAAASAPAASAAAPAGSTVSADTAAAAKDTPPPLPLSASSMDDTSTSVTAPQEDGGLVFGDSESKPSAGIL